MRPPPKLVSVPLCCALALSAGCATSYHAPPGTDPEGVRVVVENHGFEDMAIYAASAGFNLRLGHVSSGRTAAFQIRSLSSRAADLELLAVPMARSDTNRSGRLLVYAGQTVTWTIHQGRLGDDVRIR